MKILLVGGTFTNIENEDGAYGKPSGLIRKMADVIRNYQLRHPSTAQENQLALVNGGPYTKLPELLMETSKYDIVF